MLFPKKSSSVIIFSLIFTLICVACSFAGEPLAVKDALGNEFTPDSKIERVICSGSGCLRLLTYLQAQDMIIGVEDNEKRTSLDPRPYFLANKDFFKSMPLIGEFRGSTRPELVVSLPSLPQIIFKTYPEAGTPAVKLQEATGITVIPLEYGNLLDQRDKLYSTIRIMGQVIDKRDRAEAVISFMDEIIKDLSERTAGISEKDRRTAYIGGVSYRGAHGLRSTEKGYPPFFFTGTRNVAFAGEKLEVASAHADVSREKILEWDPQEIFIDLGTLRTPAKANALNELENDSLWQNLGAIRSGEVYGVLPYNSYTQNFGSILADAYFVGKVLYPEHFRDIDPAVKADEIFEFLIGEKLFDRFNGILQNKAFTKLEL